MLKKTGTALIPLDVACQHLQRAIFFSSHLFDHLAKVPLACLYCTCKCSLKTLEAKIQLLDFQVAVAEPDQFTSQPIKKKIQTKPLVNRKLWGKEIS